MLFFDLPSWTGAPSHVLSPKSRESFEHDKCIHCIRPKVYYSYAIRQKYIQLACKSWCKQNALNIVLASSCRMFSQMTVLPHMKREYVCKVPLNKSPKKLKIIRKHIAKFHMLRIYATVLHDTSKIFAHNLKSHRNAKHYTILLLLWQSNISTIRTYRWARTLEYSSLVPPSIVRLVQRLVLLSLAPALCLFTRHGCHASGSLNHHIKKKFIFQFWNTHLLFKYNILPPKLRRIAKESLFKRPNASKLRLCSRIVHTKNYDDCNVSELLYCIFNLNNPIQQPTLMSSESISHLRFHKTSKWYEKRKKGPASLRPRRSTLWSLTNQGTSYTEPQNICTKHLFSLLKCKMLHY